MPDGVRGTSRTVVSPEGWKLALYDNDNCMLFDRRRDPLELNNLYYRDTSRDAIRRLRGRIEASQKRTRDTAEIRSKI